MCLPNQGKERTRLETPSSELGGGTNVHDIDIAGGANQMMVEPELMAQGDQDETRIPTIPLIIGPYSIIPTVETNSTDFVVPPYLVVEVDDDAAVVHQEEEVADSRRMYVKKRIKWRWPNSWNPFRCFKIFLRNFRDQF